MLLLVALFICLSSSINGSTSYLRSETANCSIKIVDHARDKQLTVNHTEVQYNGSVEWTVLFYSKESLNIVWLGHNNSIPNSNKYKISNSQLDDDRYITSLAINDVRSADVGEYSVSFNSIEREFCNASRVFRLHILPIVRMPSFVAVNNTGVLIECEVIGEPPPDVEWIYELKYPQLFLIPKRDRIRGVRHINRYLDRIGSVTVGNKRTSTVRLHTGYPAYLTCAVQTCCREINSTAIVDYMLLRRDVSIKQDPEVWTTSKAAQLLCEVKCDEAELKWTHNGQPVIQVQGIFIEPKSTRFKQQVRLHISNVTMLNSGSYECHVFRALENRTLVIVHHVRLQMHDYNNSPQVKKVHLNGTLGLSCSEVYQPSSVEWFKDNIELPENAFPNRYQFANKPTTPGFWIPSSSTHTLTIWQVRDGDEGLYSCRTLDKYGVKREDNFEVQISEEVTARTWPVYGVSALLLLAIGVGYYFYWREHHRRMLLKRAGIAHFIEGNMRDFDPKLSRTEQADLLPYDQSFEFPRDRLCVSGVRLGRGAFGVVFRAVALDIQPGVAETTVAVKTIEHRDRDEDIKALIAELKIMIHMGRHVNVVRLLGAVTCDIRKRSLFVILEFCELGNLCEFLKKNRERFVNQVDREGVQIDSDATQQLESGTLSTVPEVQTNTNDDSEIGSKAITPGTICEANHSSSDYVSSGIQTITTTDLVCWSFQVARGMTYLVSRGVLHGDLAARNILLCSDKIVKICDFGLSRALKPNADYMKESEGKLPIKWLAIESISHRIFNASTDVWSFGVFMWELFSMAQTPFAGVPAEAMQARLEAGHRLSRPRFATRRLFEMMSECWTVEPTLRPPFRALEQRLGEMLPAEVRQTFEDPVDQYMTVIDEDDDEDAVGYVRPSPSGPALGGGDRTLVTIETSDQSPNVLSPVARQ